MFCIFSLFLYLPRFTVPITHCSLSLKYHPRLPPGLKTVNQITTWATFLDRQTFYIHLKLGFCYLSGPVCQYQIIFGYYHVFMYNCSIKMIEYGNVGKNINWAFSIVFYRLWHVVDTILNHTQHAARRLSYI